MAIIIPEKLVGRMPCMWCGNIVTTSSMDGPGVCALCDIGCKVDETTGEIRKWNWRDSEQRNFLRGEIHEAFINAMWEHINIFQKNR